MAIIIFADASYNIGQGHVTRTLSLAKELRKRGVSVEYFCRPLDGDQISRLRGEGFNVHTPLEPEMMESGLDKMTVYAEWSNVAPVLKTVSEKKKIDWAIVDNYSIGVEFEVSLSEFGCRVMAIDDLPNRKHFCDLLLDQNYNEDQTRYNELIPESCIKLLGCEYSLLRPEFELRRRGMKNRDGEISKILISYGGYDKTGETLKAMMAVAALDGKSMSFIVVLGERNKDINEIQSLSVSDARFALYAHVSHMDELMEEADITLGAGGSTTWERCCLGLPALITVTAENQNDLADMGIRSGAMQVLGRWDEVTSEMITDKIEELIKHPEHLVKMSEKAKGLVDGLGAAKVASTMNSIKEEKMDMQSRLEHRQVVKEDCDLIFEWVNEDMTRKASFNQEEINYENHVKWFEGRVESSLSEILVFTESNQPIGQVRLESDGCNVEIGISIDVSARGKGHSFEMLTIARQHSRRMFTGQPIIAHIKHENEKSINAFTRSGFELVGEVEFKEHLCFMLMAA